MAQVDASHVVGFGNLRVARMAQNVPIAIFVPRVKFACEGKQN
jgi:hypothetical protein